jgi:hypothetical protein
VSVWYLSSNERDALAAIWADQKTAAIEKSYWQWMDGLEQRALDRLHLLRVSEAQDAEADLLEDLVTEFQDLVLDNLHAASADEDWIGLLALFDPGTFDAVHAFRQARLLEGEQVYVMDDVQPARIPIHLFDAPPARETYTNHLGQDGVFGGGGTTLYAAVWEDAVRDNLQWLTDLGAWVLDTAPVAPDYNTAVNVTLPPDQPTEETWDYDTAMTPALPSDHPCVVEHCIF